MKVFHFALFMLSADALKTLPHADLKSASVEGFTEGLHENKDGLTLRKWIESQSCLNMASLPLMNTQFAQLGAICALNDEGILDKVTGVSGISTGAFISAIAASKNVSHACSEFRRIWPGWSSFGDKDPEISNNYKKRVLDKILPEKFEDLKIPLAVAATHYHSEEAARSAFNTKADPVVISDGDLREAVIVSSSALMGNGCPRCETGFQAKAFRGMWPVADGFLKDEYGTAGLHALKQCKNLLHVMPQNYPQQLKPTPNANLDTQPTNVVSLGIDVPSSAIMSMLWKRMDNSSTVDFLHAMFPKVDFLKSLGANQDNLWEKIQYETAYEHMKEQLDKPMMIREEPNHYYVDLRLIEHWQDFRGKFENMWDKNGDKMHTDYWIKTTPRRNAMVADRNMKIAQGSLSYRPGGNGKGAPKKQVSKSPIV